MAGILLDMIGGSWIVYKCATTAIAKINGIVLAREVEECIIVYSNLGLERKLCDEIKKPSSTSKIWERIEEFERTGLLYKFLGGCADNGIPINKNTTTRWKEIANRRMFSEHDILQLLMHTYGKRLLSEIASSASSMNGRTSGSCLPRYIIDREISVHVKTKYDDMDILSEDLWHPDVTEILAEETSFELELDDALGVYRREIGLR